MCNVAVSWESIVPAVIQNCFAKYGFVILCEVIAEEDEKNEWVEFQSHINCPSNFKKFPIVDKSISATDDQKTSLDGPSCDHMATSVATA
jgi:hypothetical protein